MSIAENVALPLREHTDLDDELIGVITRMKLDFVNLLGKEDLLPSELSGGMLKRAAVARAIALDPKLTFMDEPSAGLDPVIAAALDDLIIKLKQSLGMSVIVVTHELESAFKIADRIVVLDRGFIIFSGTPEEIRASDNERIQNLINRVPEEEEFDAELYARKLIGKRSNPIGVKLMKVQSREFVAGSFVLGGLIAFLVIISVLGDFMQRTDAYYTRVNNVSGLKQGAAVIYEGYIIGSVTGITPEPGDEGMSFRVDLDIQKDWRIPETSEASIAAMSLLSAVAIQIRAGTGPALEPGTMIAASKQMNFVDELSETADNIANIAEEHVVPLLNTIDELLSTHGAETLTGVNSLATGLAFEAPQVANLNRVVNSLDALVKSVDPDRLDQAMDDIETILDNSKMASANAVSASETVNGTLLPETASLIENSNVAIQDTRQQVVASLKVIQADMQQITAEITVLLAKSGGVADGAEGLMEQTGQILDTVDGAVQSSNDVIVSSGEQLATIMTRLDRAALNIEEMTSILKNNPGVLITGTE